LVTKLEGKMIMLSGQIWKGVWNLGWVHFCATHNYYSQAFQSKTTPTMCANDKNLIWKTHITSFFLDQIFFFHSWMSHKREYYKSIRNTKCLHRYR